MEQEQLKKAAKKQIFKISTATSLTVIAIIILTNVIFLGIMAIMGDAYADFTANVLDDMSFSLVIQDIIMLIGLLVYCKIIKVDLKAHFAKPQMKKSEIFSLIIIATGMGQLVSVITNLLMTLVTMTTGFEIGTVSFVSERNILSTIVMSLAIAVGAPVLEELFFRASFFTPLVPHGRVFAITVTAVLFGLYHMNIPQIPAAMVWGFFFAYISLESRSIIPAILGHVFNNSFGALQYALMGNLDINRIAEGDTAYAMENLGTFIPIAIISFSIYGIIFAAIILFIIRLAKRGKNAFRITGAAEEKNLLTKGEAFAAYFINPATIILMLMVIGMTIFTVIGMR